MKSRTTRDKHDTTFLCCQNNGRICLQCQKDVSLGTCETSVLGQRCNYEQECGPRAQVGLIRQVCQDKKAIIIPQASDFGDRVVTLNNLIGGVEEIVSENWERGASKDMILMDQVAALNFSLLGLDEALGDSNAQLQSSIDEQGC